MINTILQGWNLMRFLRLAVGGYGLFQGISTNDSLLIIAGGFLLVTGVFNIGCCGVNGCSVIPKRKPANPKEQPEFEEIH